MKPDSGEVAGPPRTRLASSRGLGRRRPTPGHRSTLHLAHRVRRATRLLAARRYPHRRLSREKRPGHPAGFPSPLERSGRLHDTVQVSSFIWLRAIALAFAPLILLM